jgi:hypothetical protein
MRHRNPRGDAALSELRPRFAAGEVHVLPHLSAAYRRAGLDLQVSALAERFVALGLLLANRGGVFGGHRDPGSDLAWEVAEVLSIPLYHEARELGVDPANDHALRFDVEQATLGEGLIMTGDWLHRFAGDVRDPALPLGWRRR